MSHAYPRRLGAENTEKTALNEQGSHKKRVSWGDRIQCHTSNLHTLLHFFSIMALGPVAKVVAQAVLMGVSVLARAIPAAYGAALQNAKKGGVDAAKATSEGILSRKKMSLEEALMVMNLEKSQVTAESVQKQYDKYFAANEVEKGGSFYLQSKIYRAKEQLDEFIKEGREQQKQ